MSNSDIDMDLSIYTINQLKEIIRNYNEKHQIKKYSKLNRDDLDNIMRKFLKFINGSFYGISKEVNPPKQKVIKPKKEKYIYVYNDNIKDLSNKSKTELEDIIKDLENRMNKFGNEITYVSHRYGKSFNDYHVTKIQRFKTQAQKFLRLKNKISSYIPKMYTDLIKLYEELYGKSNKVEKSKITRRLKNVKFNSELVKTHVPEKLTFKAWAKIDKENKNKNSYSSY